MQDPIPDQSATDCDSCGAAGPDLIGVRRVYLRSTVESRVAAGDDAEILADIEQWCFPCRTHYPHVDVP